MKGGDIMSKLKGLFKSRNSYTDFDSLPIMLNVSQLAAIMQISRAGAYNLINSEGFPKIIVGTKRVLVAKAALIQWLEEQKSKINGNTNSSINGGINHYGKTLKRTRDNKKTE